MENASDSPHDTPKKHTFLFWSGIVVIAILLILSIGVMTLPSVECFFINLTGAGDKLEVLKLVGWGISGLIAIFGVVGLFQRAEALDKQNIINEKNHKQQAGDIEKGHVQERFKAATEHLGNEQVSVRIAAFYEFYHLAKTKEDWQISIFYILCAHLRHTTKHKDYNKEVTKKIKPTEEVQSLLNILFKPDNKGNFIFAGMVADLEEVYLPGANLENAYLQNAYLKNADMQEANMQNADMQEAKLQNTNLFSTDLRNANLTNAKLQNAYMQNADMQNANMQNANMFSTDLRNTNLHEANLQGAYLTNAKLRGAYLRRADLQEARLHDAHLQGAYLIDAKLRGAYLHNAKINKDTTRMPHDWEKVVEKGANDETEVIFVKD